MGKTQQQLRYQFFTVAACLFAVMVALSLLVLASIVLCPGISQNIPIVIHVVNHILPIGLKGLAMADIIVIAMATFDSFLHTAELTLMHEVMQPVCKRLGALLHDTVEILPSLRAGSPLV